MIFLDVAFILGGLLVSAASIGLLRFGEGKNIVYARVHIAGAVDIACIFLVFILGQPLVALAYLLLMPLSGHAIAHAHYLEGGKRD
jgi:energy-converting hydrogenase B subunit C